jgi:hypothetical protein
MRDTIALALVALFAPFAAHALPPKPCPASSKAWMPSGTDVAAACPFEPLFKEPVVEIGSDASCHYDFGKAAGMAGFSVVRDLQKSPEAAAKDAVAMYSRSPKFSGEAKKMPWAGLDAYEFVVTMGGSPMVSGYYAGTKKGVFKIELWTSDRSKTASCAEKVIRAIVQKIGG